MSPNTARPVAEPLSIAGPAGNLEALLETPVTAVHDAPVAVICHPNPIQGGTMTNKVVHMLAKSFNELGARTVRFNYRGVGASAGQYDEGNGETDDALAIIDWAKSSWPDTQLWLGGFSFGGGVALRAAARRDVQRLVTVAPAIRHVAVDPSKLPTCPWLLVQGDRDDLVDAADIQRWMQTLAHPPELA